MSWGTGISKVCEKCCRRHGNLLFTVFTTRINSHFYQQKLFLDINKRPTAITTIKVTCSPLWFSFLELAFLHRHILVLQIKNMEDYQTGMEGQNKTKGDGKQVGGNYYRMIIRDPILEISCRKIHSTAVSYMYTFQGPLWNLFWCKDWIQFSVWNCLNFHVKDDTLFILRQTDTWKLGVVNPLDSCYCQSSPSLKMQPFV